MYRPTSWASEKWQLRIVMSQPVTCELKQLP